MGGHPFTSLVSRWKHGNRAVWHPRCNGRSDMNTNSARPRTTLRLLLASTALAGVLAVVPSALAAPTDDTRVLAIDQYTSEKARRLATTHARALQELNASVYHCLPWLEIHKQSIGFFKPKGAAQ